MCCALCNSPQKSSNMINSSLHTSIWRQMFILNNTMFQFLPFCWSCVNLAPKIQSNFCHPAIKWSNSTILRILRKTVSLTLCLVRYKIKGWSMRSSWYEEWKWNVGTARVPEHLIHVSSCLYELKLLLFLDGDVKIEVREAGYLKPKKHLSLFR